MFLKATAGALALLAMATTPVIAYAQMSPSNSMMENKDTTMKPAMKNMTKSEMAMMTKCKKMSPRMMSKNKACTKMMAMHPNK